MTDPTKPDPVIRAYTLIGIAGAVIGAIWSISALYHQTADHEIRIKKIEDAISVQLVQLQKSVDYATWRIDALSKDIEKRKR